MLAGRFVVSVTFVLGACGDDGAGPIDAAPVPVDIDNGSCGAQIRFTGEYIDWDSHASFCGINEALIEVNGGAMDSTAPNGRFDLCIPDAPSTRLDVTQPTAMSQCTTPPSSYSIPTILFAQKAVIQSGGFFSGRAFTTERQASFFTRVGAAFDSTKAQVFVHVDGPERTVSIAAAHGTTQAVRSGVAANDWVAGAQGIDIFFSNVDVGTGTTMLTTDTAALGTGSIPLVAGTITNVSLKSN
jgi:hypothetical protein